MGMELSDADKALLTPDELATLTGSNAEQQLATMGDGEAADETTADTAEAEVEAAAATEGEGDPIPAEDLAAIVAEGEQADTPAPAPAPAPEVKQFAVGDTTELETKLGDIRTRTVDLNRKWADGELSDAEYSAQQEALQTERDAVNRQIAKAEALREINEQNARDQQVKREADINAGVAALLAESQKEGSPLNYATDPTAGVEFDAFLNAVATLPQHANKTGAELARLAHNAVLAARGIAPRAAAPAPAPTPAPSAAPAPKAPRAVPQTLGGLPNAAPAHLSDELQAQISTMDALELEDFMSKQPKAITDRLMKSADAAFRAGR